ncbi:ATP-binding protein [Salinibacterium sp. G-O1]|uniref:ATP-binding protein n=1 Tax=Salinibacterium sp. G-O1 TaxID=3046208 RepID=UPI0024B89D66|nr:ATP-binding protein [Salinibacterium sp. G-O1]MDJ0336595.1 ATP-binding protein [Salinibacterium sp. G-O1]
MPAAPLWYGSSVQANGIYPFTAGTARPVSGAPCGTDLLTRTAVALDHYAFYVEGVISSPSMFLFGINGVGKSSTAQTMTLGMMARGMIPAVFNPLKKGEHTPLVEQAGGSVFEFGPNSRHQLNLLSVGPLGRAAAQIGGAVGEELYELAMWKITKQAQLALRVSRGNPLTDMEDAVVEALVQGILARSASPVTRDLRHAFREPSEAVLSLTRTHTPERFEEKYHALGDSIEAMLSGDLGRLLGGTESIEIDAGNRGGFCFDTSSIPQSATTLLSTAMLMSWSLGMDSIDAHWELAKHEASKAAAAAAEGETYVPAVTWSGYTTLMDEFWYPMRAAPGIVDRVDALSRSNRSVGTAEMKITHSPKDMMSLPNAEDREKARGLAERSGLLGLMALTVPDLEELAKIKPLTDKEIAMVSQFNAAESWGAKARTGDASSAPPGAGRVLFKVEGRPGVAVKMIQTPTQKGFHITDERFRAQSRRSDDRRVAV